MATPVVDTQATMELSPLQKLATKYPPALVQEVKKLADEENTKNFARLAEEVRAENKEQIDKALIEFKEKMTPPTPEQLQKLLTQELLEFKIIIKGRGKDEKEERHFVIQELPQKIEKKLLRLAKDRLVPIATEISSLTMNLLEGDAAKKLIDLMNAFEPVLDVLCSMAATILNPYGDLEDVDEQWVQDHLTTQRIATIVVAQFECNRLRDFLLLASKSFR